MTSLGLVVMLALSAAKPMSELSVPELTLQDTDGRAHRLRAEVSKSKWTVVTFFSADCPCQLGHDALLSQLAKELEPQGVMFMAVASEQGATTASLRAEASKRRYPYPLVVDPQGQLAKALGAEFATFTVIFDSTGRAHYRGGIDSARREPTPATEPYLSTALRALVSAREPATPEPKTLGCYLRM